MSVKEHDPLTGHATTGHDWNGITELNTRVPRVIWVFIAATHLFALIAWLLLPSWPLVNTYWPGLLGANQQAEVEETVREARMDRAVWTERLETLPVEDIVADPELMDVVNSTAPALYGDNCAVCHGARGDGGPGFPSLADRSWLWGSEPEAVLETLRVGINSSHPDARIGQMLAFGRDGLLSRGEVSSVVEYVRSLSGAEADPDVIPAGAELFAENCASCHGDAAKGDPEQGAPDLTDGFWIYGGDRNAVFESVFAGRAGQMPAWEERLPLWQRKILAIYVLQLAEGANP